MPPIKKQPNELIIKYVYLNARLNDGNVCPNWQRKHLRKCLMSKGKLCGWRKKLRNLTTGTCFSWNGN